MKFLTFDESRDFPYYNHNPRISKSAWIVLLLSVPIAYLVFCLASFVSEIFAGLLFCLIMLIPLLYYSNWDYKLFIRKPTKNEIILAILLFVGYMIYSILMGNILDYFSLSAAASDTSMVNVDSFIGLLFSMMGEELLKFIPFIFFMRLVYKFSGNRNLAVVVSTALVLIGFALLHYYPPYATLASVFLLQGLGSLFEMYGYIKTKNILVPYMSHLFTDAFIFILIMFAF